MQERKRESGRESESELCDIRERIWRICAVRQTVPCLWRHGENLTYLCCTSDGPVIVTSGRESDVSVLYVRQSHICDVRERSWRVCAVRQTVPCSQWSSCAYAVSWVSSLCFMHEKLNLLLLLNRNVLSTKATAHNLSFDNNNSNSNLYSVIPCEQLQARGAVHDHKKMNNTPVQLCHPSNTQLDSRIISILSSSTTLMSAFVKIRTGNGCFESSAFLF